MNYLAMRTQFLSTLNRTDCTDALAKTFFDLGAALIQRELRAPFMEKELDVNTSSADVSQVTVPTDYLETKLWACVLPDSSSRELVFLDNGSFVKKGNLIENYPVWYTRRGSNFYFEAALPMGSTAYMMYWSELPPLVNDTDEPTLALIAPDLYIYAALIYAADWAQDDRKTQWQGDYTTLRDVVQLQAADEDISEGTNAVQPAYNFDDESW